MDTAYLKGRLAASVELVNAASSTCARRAHEGMVSGYRALLTKRRSTEPLKDEAVVTERELESWADDGGPDAPAQ